MLVIFLILDKKVKLDKIVNFWLDFFEKEGIVRDIVLKNGGLDEELKFMCVINVKVMFKKLTEIVLIDGAVFE